MTQFYYNFSADSLGNVPSYITLRRNAVNADYQIVDISGIKNLRYLSSSASSAKAASYNLAVSSGKTEIYGEIQDLDSSDPASARLILFATDSPDSEYGTHYDSAFGSAGRFVVYRRVNGTFAELSVSSSETEGFRFSKYKVRFQVEPGSPNQIKAKFWLAGNPEPESWKIQTTDNARTITTGWSGHVGFAVSDTVYYQAVAIGTEGDPAPTGPISNPAQSILASAINSTEQFGQLALSPGATSILATAIESTEQFGIADFVAGPVSILASGIPSEEVVSPMAFYAGGSAIFADGIPSNEQFGAASFMPGLVSISAVAIASEAIVSTPEFIAGPAVISAESFPSAELFGDLTLFNVQQLIRLVGISTTEAFGSTTLEGGADISGWLTGRLNIKPALTASVGVNRVH